MSRLSPILILVFCLFGCTEADPPAAALADNPPDGESAVLQPVGNEPAEAEQVDAALADESRQSIGEISEATGIPALAEAWTGDLDGMVERRVIRVLTVYGLGRYFLDGPRERGATYEFFKMFEEEINSKFGRKNIRIHVVFVPVARDELIPGLLNGRGDIASAGLTITAERLQQVDFSDPATRPLSEILVTGPAAEPLGGIEDLAGKEIHVRHSSSYRESLEMLNQQFLEAGKPSVQISDISEFLEDEDLLEMVNSGLLDWAVVDDYKAEIWADVFEHLDVRKDIVFREGGQIGFAIRKNSPQLKEALNEFLKSHRQGTLKGNVLLNRYFRDFDWAHNALAANDFARFRHVVDIFRKYGDQYGFDYLIVAAQGYQESRLDQKARSHAGAVGIMQLLPTTAADPNVGIPDISTAELNIHAGVRYLDFIRKRYFSDPDIDHYNQTLFALASYNAGPARIVGLRKKAAAQGYDPNRWFDNVEILAAREVGSEPVKYVANILKYYVAYRLSIVRMVQRGEQRQQKQVDP